MADQPPIAGFAELVKEIQFISDKFRSEKHCASPFSDAEIAQIKRAAQLIQWFDTLGWIGKRVTAIMAGAVILIMNWERLAEFLNRMRGQ